MSNLVKRSQFGILTTQSYRNVQQFINELVLKLKVEEVANELESCIRVPALFLFRCQRY